MQLKQHIIFLKWSSLLYYLTQKISSFLDIVYTLTSRLLQHRLIVLPPSSSTVCPFMALKQKSMNLVKILRSANSCRKNRVIKFGKTHSL